MEVHCCYGTLVPRQLPYQKQGYDKYRPEGAGHCTLYKILELSTSQIVTVRSAPPTATRRPPSSRLQAPLRMVFSKPAGAPVSTRWMRFGEGANGRMSWMMVCDENDGERRYEPFGDIASAVGVSTWPLSTDTSSCFRKSRTLGIILSTISVFTNRTHTCIMLSRPPA